VRPSPGLEARRLALLALFEDEFRPAQALAARDVASDPAAPVAPATGRVP